MNGMTIRMKQIFRTNCTSQVCYLQTCDVQFMVLMVHLILTVIPFIIGFKIFGSCKICDLINNKPLHSTMDTAVSLIVNWQPTLWHNICETRHNFIPINMWEERENMNIMREAVVQWSEFGHVNLGSRVWSPDIHWPLFYLWYYCRMVKDYIIAAILSTDRTYNSICIWGCSSSSLFRSQHIQERT